MPRKVVDVEAYKKFLLSSPLGEAFSNKIYTDEILAMAILSVLAERNIVTRREVNDVFDRIFNARYSHEMSVMEESDAPDEFLIDVKDFDE